MTPLIRRLKKTFPELPYSEAEQSPLNWTYMKGIKKLGPKFYRKVIPMHLVLHIEYSLLWQQLRAKFLDKQSFNPNEVKELLLSALMLAELLEHTYQHYLIVPREVILLRQQQELYRQLLANISTTTANPDQAQEFSQRIRNTTININLYRLLLIRSKRALDLIATLDTGSETYRNFVRILDNYTDPVLAHLAWFFYLPRLLVNFFLILKHTIPHMWIGKKEKDLGWDVRFTAQMQRRWFELGNDLAWVSVGFINCFYLTGVLAPFAVYLSIACFAFDVIMATTRAYIELSRLFDLRNQYEVMRSELTSPEEQKALEEHINAINKQIDFEKLRLGSHVMTTSAIFLSMCCAAPVFALMPIIPVIGAICLVTICFINFALVHILNEHRPRDAIEISPPDTGKEIPEESIKTSSGMNKLRFFSHSQKEQVKTDSEMEDIPASRDTCSLGCIGL
ncbi:MAG: hypothetical protein ACRCXC_03460 [Legionella sp.]